MHTAPPPPPAPLMDAAWGEQSPWPWGHPSLPEVQAVLVARAASSGKGMEQVSRFIQWHRVTKKHLQPAQLAAWALEHHNQVL